MAHTAGGQGYRLPMNQGHRNKLSRSNGRRTSTSRDSLLNGSFIRSDSEHRRDRPTTTHSLFLRPVFLPDTTDVGGGPVEIDSEVVGLVGGTTGVDTLREER